MNIIKISLLTLLICFATQLNAATEAEKEAEQLLEMMNMERTLRASMEQVLTIQLQTSPELLPYKPVMMEFFEKHMSYQSLKPALIKIYSEAFTASELKEINAFYKTEVGQKTIKQMPTLVAKGAQLGSFRVQQNLSELEDMIRAETERLEKLQQPD